MSIAVSHALLQKMVKLSLVFGTGTQEIETPQFTDDEIAVLQARSDMFDIENNPQALFDQLVAMYGENNMTTYKDPQNLVLEAQSHLRDFEVPFKVEQHPRSIPLFDFNKSKFVWVIVDLQDGNFADVIFRKSSKQWKFHSHLLRDASVELFPQQEEDEDESYEDESHGEDPYYSHEN